MSQINNQLDNWNTKILCLELRNLEETGSFESKAVTSFVLDVEELFG